MNVTFWWNIGRLLIFLIIIQIVSGVLVTFYYFQGFFYSNLTNHLDMVNGDLIQLIHANFPGIIFFFIYLHICKGLLLGSFIKIKRVWVSGWLVLVLLIGTAFLGYVLPWGQIRLWGATVIINLLTVIPKGQLLVTWVWGGYFVSEFTVKVFYSLHFLMPFMLLLIIMLHITTLHFKGSSNWLGIDSNLVKIEFSPNFLYKDILNFIPILWILGYMIQNSFILLDAENFLAANLIVSPIHIKPEWYFLQFYAILRAIPNKLGGVILFAIALILIIILYSTKSYLNISSFKIWKILCHMFIIVNLLLIWVGGCAVENPYLVLSQTLTISYFLLFLALKVFF